MNELAEVEQQIKALHEQLVAGEIFLDLGKQLAQLSKNLKGHRREKFENHELDPLFMVELQMTANNDLIDHDRPLAKGLVEALPGALQTTKIHIRHQLVGFINWAVEHHRLSNEQLQWLTVNLLQAKYFYNHLTERNSPAVYGRSLGLVYFRYLLYAARKQKKPIKLQVVKRLINRLAVAMLAERDTRGFVEGAGWVQIFAAYAGLCNEICADDRLKRADKLFLMASFLKAYEQLTTPLTMSEPDEGVGFINQTLKTHPLYRRYFINELQEWRKKLDTLNMEKTATWHQVFNHRHLLQTMLMDETLPPEIADAIMNQENNS